MSDDARNLLVDVAGLLDRLVEDIAKGEVLDAFLTAAAANQATEDFQAGDWPRVLRAVDAVVARTGRMGTVAWRAIEAAHRFGLARVGPQLGAWQQQLARMTDQLAACVVGQPLGEGEHGAAVGLRDGLAALPDALGTTVARLPSCFHSFDQRPDDVARLADRFTSVHPDRTTPLRVAGIRTSGSYLGPLAAAALRARSYEDVAFLTLRTGTPLSPAARSSLLPAVGGRGLVLVIDDPPASGGAVGSALVLLERAGVPADRIVLLLALLTQVGEIPPSLRRWQAVALPYADWAVHDQLTPAAVHADLEVLLAPAAVVAVDTVADLFGMPNEPGRRGHLRRRYDVVVREAGVDRRRSIVALGTGLGRFGWHAAAVSTAVDQAVSILGVRNGVVYRDWLDGIPAASAPPGQEATVVSWAVGYVASRAAALPLPASVGPAHRGQGTVAEVAGRLLGRVFGRGSLFVRLLSLDAVCRQLLESPTTSEIDGDLTLAGIVGRLDCGQFVDLVRVDAEVFGLSNLPCFDPAMDAVSFALDACAQPSARWSKSTADLPVLFSKATGDEVSPERWLLLSLVRLWDLHRSGRLDGPGHQRLAGASVRRYLTGSLLATDSGARATGSFVALDLDGVVEGSSLGFPAPTPTSVLAIRALHQHGLRPLVVTGRSLAELRERCVDYGLVGGVAEYGCLAYDGASGAVLEATGADERAALGALRVALEREPDVGFDDTFSLVVRAFCTAGGSGRGPLPPAVTARALAASGGGLRAVEGDDQTDFVPESIDKATGITALLSLLAPEVSDRVIVAAVGDTEADLPMLRVAQRAFAPAHARRPLAAAATLMDRPFQDGFSDAVAEIVGHGAGCGQCASTPLSPTATALHALLDAASGSRRAMVVRGVRLTRAGHKLKYSS